MFMFIICFMFSL
uniref:Uncharacterized protein n=1 Tax=Anguilla anguilla TaxID=7936 RepID=A0A0E9P8G9_ANGAN